MIATATVPTLTEKQAALAELLHSHTFARSEQLRKFLQFVCEKEMLGLGQEINEYLIGVEVLGRPASYSPGEDATVRNRAYALRSKLQEYYSHENPTATVRVELHKGSYCPNFVLIASPAIPSVQVAPTEASSAVLMKAVPVQKPFQLHWRWKGIAAIFLLAAVAVAAYWLRKPKTALEEFWAPMLSSAHPVLICTTQPVVYQLDGQAREKLLQRQATPSNELSPNFNPMPDQLLPGSEVVAVTDQYVGIGTAHAAAQITAYLTRMQKASHIKIGNEASFADLRQSPVVTVGAFGNRWTMSVANKLRFVFEERDVHHRFIVDRTDPSKKWGFEALPITGKVAEDFVIISRVFQSETGEMLVAGAGITQYGTRAAGEFLTNPVYLETLMQNAPGDWQKKNFQIVLSVKIIDNTPGPPMILATHFW